MGLTTFRVPISGLVSTWAGTGIIGETRFIPQSAPYTLLLDRIPKVQSTGSNVLDNTYVSIADMIAAGISLTIGGVAGTLVASSTPSSGEVYFQIIDSTYDFSPQLTFNATDKGKEVVVNYTGYMSNLAGAYITALQNAVTRLEELPECALLSYNEYSGGRFDDTVADTTGIYVVGARGEVVFTTGRYAFTTTAVDLTTGVTQVSAFTDVDGWKQIGIWLIDNSGTVEVRIVEGAEAATAGATTAPAAYAGDAIFCGVAIVQGDNTGAAGGIESVLQANITSQAETLRSSQFGLSWVEFQVDGPLVVEDLADAPVWPGVAGVPVACYAVSLDMGDDDSALTFDIKRDDTTSIFSSLPSLASGGGGGTVQTFSSTSIDATDGPFSASEWLSLSVTVKPTNGDTLRVRLYYREEA